jgi:hypothetical protein
MTIGEKLSSVGYRCYWFGKGHTGYMSMNHLPLQLGFVNFTGFLSGAQSHFASKRWEGNLPFDATTYSAELYGERAVTALEAYTPGGSSPPLFFYLPWQNVRIPVCTHIRIHLYHHQLRGVDLTRSTVVDVGIG